MFIDNSIFSDYKQDRMSTKCPFILVFSATIFVWWLIFLDMSCNRCWFLFFFLRPLGTYKYQTNVFESVNNYRVNKSNQFLSRRLKIVVKLIVWQNVDEKENKNQITSSQVDSKDKIFIHIQSYLKWSALYDVCRKVSVIIMCK